MRHLINVMGRIGFIAIAMSLAIFVSIAAKFSQPHGGGAGGQLNPNEVLLLFPGFGAWKLAAEESLLVELEVSGSEATVYVMNGMFSPERVMGREDFEKLIEEGKIQVLYRKNVMGSAQLEYTPIDTPVSVILFMVNEGQVPLELRRYHSYITRFLLPTERATAISQLMFLAGVVMSAPRITKTILSMFAKRTQRKNTQ